MKIVSSGEVTRLWHTPSGRAFVAVQSPFFYFASKSHLEKYSAAARYGRKSDAGEIDKEWKNIRSCCNVVKMTVNCVPGFRWARFRGPIFRFCLSVKYVSKNRKIVASVFEPLFSIGSLLSEWREFGYFGKCVGEMRFWIIKVVLIGHGAKKNFTIWLNWVINALLFLFSCSVISNW